MGGNGEAKTRSRQVRKPVRLTSNSTALCPASGARGGPVWAPTDLGGSAPLALSSAVLVALQAPHPELVQAACDVHTCQPRGFLLWPLSLWVSCQSDEPGYLHSPPSTSRRGLEGPQVGAESGSS